MPCWSNSDTHVGPDAGSKLQKCDDEAAVNEVTLRVVLQEANLYTFIWCPLSMNNAVTGHRLPSSCTHAAMEPQYPVTWNGLNEW